MRRPAQAVLVHGVTGGLLAGLVVALWFLVADTVAGHPFRTPALLAGILLNREFSAVTFRLVAVYTVLHFAVFAILGVGMAWVSAAFTAPPRLLLSLGFGVLLQEVTFYVGLVLLHAPHLGVVPWPHIVGANIAAGLVLMGYLHYAEHDPRPLRLTALRALTKAPQSSGHKRPGWLCRKLLGLLSSSGRMRFSLSCGLWLARRSLLTTLRTRHIV